MSADVGEQAALTARTGGWMSAARRPWQWDQPVSGAVAVALAGLLVTLAASGIAAVLDRRNEQSLLQVQTRQAGAVIAGSVLQLSQPLAAAAEIAEATKGDSTAFEKSLGAVTGPGRLFVSAVLVEGQQGSRAVVASVGVPPDLDPVSAPGAAFLDTAAGATTFVVRGVGERGVQRVAYAFASAGDPRYVVYAERAIPANRRVPVEGDSAFADLHFATYLGTDLTPENLATTDVDPASLPLGGGVASTTIPFGDTVITLVAQAARPLGGPLGRQLPWVFLVAGLLMTALAANWTQQLIRRREVAERDAATIQDLYARLDALYGEQRGIAVTLQRALLPRATPAIPGVESAVRYVAGAQGVDVGGDWYSLIRVDDDHFAFVVGDVSGRGVSAAGVMAQLRFTMRAYLMEGHAPDVVLRMCADQVDVVEDGHFATVLVGVADLRTRTVTLASAGHPDPLLVTEASATYARTEVGPPLGTVAATYPATTFTMPPGSMLLAFTDGLVERRTESIDVGLGRLAEVASAAHGAGTLDDAIGAILAGMAQEASEDDTAVLAFAWSDARTVAPAPGNAPSGC